MKLSQLYGFDHTIERKALTFRVSIKTLMWWHQGPMYLFCKWYFLTNPLTSDSIKIRTTHNLSLSPYYYFWIILYGNLVYFIAWEICSMKWGFAKKVIIKSQRQFMYGSNFYGSDVIWWTIRNNINPSLYMNTLKSTLFS